MKGVAFDLAGTIIDKGNNVPFLAFKNAFESEGIKITREQIFRYMGMNKKEHIKNLLFQEDIKLQWLDYWRRYPDENDVNRIHKKVSDNVFTLLNKTSLPFIPGFRSIYNFCKEKEVPIVITTGYEQSTLDIILNTFHKKNIHFDAAIASDAVGRSRPYPDMLLEACKRVNIEPEKCIKIGDTDMDVLEGKNAGALTIRTFDGIPDSKTKNNEIDTIMINNNETRIIPDFYCRNLKKVWRLIRVLIK